MTAHSKYIYQKMLMIGNTPIIFFTSTMHTLEIKARHETAMKRQLVEM